MLDRKQQILYIEPAHLIAQAEAMNIPKYKHIKTGVVAQIHGLFANNNTFIEYYWVVPGLPDNFKKEDIDNPNIFEKC